MSASSISTSSLAVAHSDGNHFPPIFSLPAELLETIFIHNAQEHYESSYVFNPGSDLPTWVNVSYVCQHWRNIALNCAILWTYHFNLSPRWTEELLRRSGEASLKISSGPRNYTAQCWLAILENLLRHSERVQEINLCLPVVYIPTKLRLRAPRLETLEIEIYGQLESNLEIIDVDTPVLQTIRLIDCLLPLHTFDLRKLDTLVMHRSVPISPLDGIDFLVALGNMPNLSVLDLSHVFPHDFLPDDLSHKIDLPRLALLMLSDDSPRNIMTLLSCIEIPLKTQVCLQIRLPFDTAREDYAPISSFLAHRFYTAQGSSTEPTIFRSLTLHVTDWVTLTWGTLERDCCSYVAISDVTHLPLRIKLQVFGDASYVERNELVHSIAAHACVALPVENVQTLYVHWSRPFQCWRELFGGLHGLRYLTIKDGDMQDLPVLSRNGNRYVMPALQELELIRIRLPDEDAGEIGRTFIHMLGVRRLGLFPNTRRSRPRVLWSSNPWDSGRDSLDVGSVVSWKFRAW